MTEIKRYYITIMSLHYIWNHEHFFLNVNVKSFNFLKDLLDLSSIV